jgi:hypothetical protein
MRAAILALTVGLGLASRALAQPGPDMERAKRLYTQANAEMAAGKYTDAARDYGDAYDVTKDPILFFKIASANEKAGRCDVAVAYYSRFLKEASPKPEFAQLAKDRIKACGGTLPGEGPVAPPPASPPEPAAPPAPPTPPPAASAPPAPPSAPPAHANVHIRDRGHEGAWLLLGGSVAFVTAGVVLAYSASSSEQDLKDLYASVDNTRPTYDAKTASRYHDLIDEGHRYQYLSWTSFGIAGACAAGAAIWFMHGGNDDDEHLSIAPVITPHESGVAARLRF